MSPIHTFAKLLPSAALIVALLLGSTAEAQIQIVIVPPEVIATTEPVYYEGHAAYWYQGHWRYRRGASWAYYSEEPQFLAKRRGHARPAPVFFHGGTYRARGGPHGGNRGNNGNHGGRRH